MGIGNDIVDILAPQARDKYLDQRYAGRAFTPRELDKINRSRKPGPMFWALWACKEAGYKAVSQEQPGVSSWPKKYKVNLIKRAGDIEDGTVNTPGGDVHVRVSLQQEYVHALAASDKKDLDRIRFGIGKYTGDGGVLKVASPRMHSRVQHRSESDNLFAGRMEPRQNPHQTARSGTINDPCPDPSTQVRRQALQDISHSFRLDCPGLEISRKKEGAKSGPPLVYYKNQSLPLILSLSHDGPYLAWAFIMNLAALPA